MIRLAIFGRGQGNAKVCAGKPELSMDQPRRWARDASPLDGDERPTFEGVLRDLKQVPPTRLIVTALFIAWAILFARYSWEAPVDLPGIGRTVPIATDAERALFDLRQTLSERRNRVGQDKRFLLEQMDHSIGTLTPSTVAMISRQDVEAALAERPGLARAFWLSTMLDEAILREWLVNIGRRNAYERMAHLLWELYLRHAVVGCVDEGGFYLPLTQADLADALGLSTVYVNKTITRLRASGIIETDRRLIRILEPAELSTIAGFDASYLHLRRFSHEAGEIFRRGRLRR